MRPFERKYKNSKVQACSVDWRSMGRMTDNNYVVSASPISGDMVMVECFKDKREFEDELEEMANKQKEIDKKTINKQNEIDKMLESLK